jgi:hypothetical protein
MPVTAYKASARWTKLAELYAAVQAVELAKQASGDSVRTYLNVTGKY